MSEKGLDLLVEIGTEEIPAGYLAPALAAIEERLAKALTEARLTWDRLTTWCTPRRLALGVWNLAAKQPDAVQEITGPPVRAAFDATGQPTKAAVGFARGQDVDVAQLITIETPKGPYLAVRKESKGRPAGQVLTDLLPQLLLGLPFPKTMRWGRGEVTFVRPVHWLLAVLDGQVLPLSFGGMESGNTSRGHRFHHPGPVRITSPDDYESRLAQAQVIASFARRKEAVLAEIQRAAAEAGPDLTILPDEELVNEVANLIEQPVAIVGRIDTSFLGLPKEVLTTAMRAHQRYFALLDREGRLAPFFIAVNNTRARDMAVVRRGHERVLRARLEDARFYFEDDRKTSLESKQEQLKGVVFHNLLGTSWQKVERFTALAGFLADRLAPRIKKTLLDAARLCKCDLVTGVVSEFPTLQGIMGRAYALAEGWPPEVADAILEHYLPNRAEGELPASEVGALLSMADKMDTIAGMFGVGLNPTGAADPFALRRQSLGIINIILDRQYRISLSELIDQALNGLTPWLKKPAAEVKAEILEFIRLRLKNQLTGRGGGADGAEAVLSLHFDDLVSCLGRTQALEKIRSRPDFADLAVAFKRVVNIIRKFGAQEGFNPGLATHPREQALLAEVDRVEALSRDLLVADDFFGLMEAIVGLKPAVDGFFDDVLVDDPDQALKTNRLALLTRVSRLFALVADFSKIAT